MKNKVILTVITVILTVALVIQSANSQEVSSAEKWDFQVTPYFWLAEFDGDLTLSGVTGSGSLPFSDLWNFTDFGLMGRVEAWKGKWGIIFDGVYMDLGVEDTVSRGPLKIDLDADQKIAMLDFGLAYRLVELPVGESQKISFDPLVGVRYAYLKQEANINPSGPLSGIVSGRTLGGDEEWVEPFFGGRIIWDITDKFAVVVRRDIGGFEIGSGSDLTWNLILGIDYQLTEKLNFKFGYRLLDIDYSRGSGNEELGVDAQMRGPIFGLTINF